MSENFQRAVFLSYASQDVAAALRLGSALRAAGVEVWFDQNELAGGDAWDAKIRRQIRECTLFIPVISAHTEARLEGYFRIEWKLAAQRTHAMAEEKAFLLPVVVDATRDADARVPAEFKDVQWTRLPEGEASPAFVARVQRLFEDGLGLQTASSASSEMRTASSAPPGHRPPKWRWPAAAGLAAVAVLALWQPWRQSGSPATTPASGLVTATDFPRDPELRRAWGFAHAADTVEDVKLAEEIVKTALARHATDTEAVIVYAWLNNVFLNRGFDVSEERFLLGRRYAEQAVKLAPDEPEALAALGQFLSFRQADLGRAEQLLRRAIELNPRVARFHRALAYNVVRVSRLDEGVRIAERSVQLFPSDALVWYELALHYRDAGRIADMEHALDGCLALAPIGAAMLWKAWIGAWIRGDVAGMKPWLDRLPANTRLSDRALILAHQYSLLTRQPFELTETLRRLQAFPGNGLRDYYYTGPKALLLGELHAALGQHALAQRQFESALADLNRDKVAAPTDQFVLSAELWTWIGLGRREEALATARLIISARQGKESRWVWWWPDVTRACLILGARDLAIPMLRQMAASENLRSQLRNALQIDPAMESFRTDPEIVALLAGPSASGSVAR